VTNKTSRSGSVSDFKRAKDVDEGGWLELGVRLEVRVRIRVRVWIRVRARVRVRVKTSRSGSVSDIKGAKDVDEGG
jgi:hypothetical protein